MTCLDDARLGELALGTLPAGERAAATAHLRGCERCRRGLAAAEEAGAAVGGAAPAASPPPELRDRLLASAAAPGRGALADLFARTFDLDLAGARGVLAMADDPARWRAGPLPGMSRLGFTPGPRHGGARAELLRFAGGTPFPRHGHGGAETVLVLEGGFTGDDGEHHAEGERLDTPPGAVHAFRCDEEGCLAASLLFGALLLEP